MVASAKSREAKRRFKLVPRMFEPRVLQLRSDLRAVLADLRGERAQAWSARDGSRYAATKPVGLATRELEIMSVTQETDAAVSLVLRDPGGGLVPQVRPGQFFALLVELDGEVLRRAYSVSSDCRVREKLSVTIKRVTGGRVSNYLNDHAAPGMRLRVLGPSGEFGCQPQAERSQARKLVLIAGGSGITPMMALLRTLLPVERGCEIALVYANRSATDVIFANAIAQLQAEHAPRLTVHALLEHAPSEWSAPERGQWLGRCDATTLARVLDQVPLARDPNATFLLCGPAPMMAGASELLRARDVPAARIRSEHFVAPQLHTDATTKLRAPMPVTIMAAQRELAVVVQPGQTLLEAGLAAGIDMPYSCAMGGCAACKVELVDGEVIQREPNCLDPAERARGYVLACVANPTTACRVRLPAARTRDQG
ncbi:Flavodoxin reductases (ferredoxin-NADPH reductases) family 1 [Enhygromyxa salina]|uniref:Flavodoxin reductases (Ferredoxin-NADPH reductases) family 1 n=1 Tax=Enhygromyxa salina TaxID=215803 RepID=A0A0C2CXA4_9BACT|nr:ferredoxin--NADP reductase [Enhygromyxa salina]KIG15651.1 Flavodoxin reductases (ferredoxin-NADPH reductases) family 1 [Enhygromyxa salina]